MAKNRRRRQPQRRQRRRRSRAVQRPSLAGMVAKYESGIRYLQCAIAPRDFPGIMAGLPDTYTGKSSVVRQKLTVPIGAPPSTADYWNASIIIPPIPNVAMLLAANHDTANPPAGPTQQWAAYDYSTAGSIFPNIDTAPSYGTGMVEMFRYVSLTAELKMVGPVLSTGGTIAAARLPGFTIVDANSTTTPKYFTGFGDATMTRLQSLPGFYVGHVNEGVYGWSIHQNPTVPFEKLWLNTKYNAFGIIDAGTVTAAPGAASGYYMGYGSQQPMGIAISFATPTTAFVVEIEAVIEYQPRANSLMAQMMSDAPLHDEAALDSYELAVRTLPAFVPAAKNDGFWENFLKAISFGAGIVGNFLGPVGKAASTLLSVGTGLIANRIGRRNLTDDQKMG